MTSTLQPPRAPDKPRTARHKSPTRRTPRSGGSDRSGLSPRHIGLVVGLMIGGAAMLVVAAMGEISGTRVPVLSSLAESAAGDNPRMIAPRPPPPATPGSCLTWRRPDAADAEAVDCKDQHLFEQAGAVQLTDIGTGDTLPDNQKFRQLVNERCTPLVINYLGGKYDPNGAFRAGALKPSSKRWSEGDRSLRCGLQRFSRSGALYPISGKIGEQDQADVRAAGTCLGIDGRFIGDPVDCALPHAVESVGSIDLGEKFKNKFPAVGDQDEFLQPACTKLAGDYAGGTKAIADKKLSVLWDNLTQESWNGGTRKVACNLAAQLPDKSGFAPVTGSVKGPVQVGDRPAPPARPTAAPGAPAKPGVSEPGPPLDGAADPDPGDEAPIPLPEQAPPAPSESKAPGPLPGVDDGLRRGELPKDLAPVLGGGGRSDGDDNNDDEKPAPLVPNPLGR
jgi:hypothetical protein